jgi:hypothetical protein
MSNKDKAQQLMQFFSYKHLPEVLASKSKPFHDLAKIMVESVPANDEMLMGLRKLLEAKDCMVRAVIFNKQPYKGELSPKSFKKEYHDQGEAHV